jgi:hypothetical protein
MPTQAERLASSIAEFADYVAILDAGDASTETKIRIRRQASICMDLMPSTVSEEQFKLYRLCHKAMTKTTDVEGLKPCQGS